jgi:hypothetical protein
MTTQEARIVTVTPEHLERAVAAVRAGDRPISQCCLVIQALKDVFPEDFADGDRGCGSLSYSSPTTGSWDFESTGTALVDAFDEWAVDMPSFGMPSLPLPLPTTFVIYPITKWDPES